MANINVTPDWKPVRQLETHELARGGPNGNLNEQAVALAARTEYLNKKVISMRDFGGIGDGAFHPLSKVFSSLSEAQEKYPFISALTQSLDWASLQLAVDSVEDGTEIDVWNYVTDEPVYIDKKIKLNFKNSVTEIEQLYFNKPIFAIKSKDVTSSGALAGIYKGIRDTSLLTLPTSTQSRLSSFYAFFNEAPRVLSTVVATHGDVSGFNFEKVDSDGQFAGSVVFANKNSASDTDSDVLTIGEIFTKNTDWGIVPIGFKNLTIGKLIARDIKNIYPNDPSHAIYVSPRNEGVMNGCLNIGVLDVQDCNHALGRQDIDTFSIRSTKKAIIDTIYLDKIGFIGNARNNASVEINYLNADLIKTESINQIIFALSAQTDSKIKINNINLMARNSSINTFVNALIQHSSGGSIELVSGRIQILGNSPSLTSLGSGGEINIHDGVEIIYQNEIPVSSSHRHAITAISGATFVNLGAIKFSGNNSRLLDIYTADHNVKINPNLIKPGITPTTFTLQSGGHYNIEFTSFDRNGFSLPALATYSSAQSCNTFNLESVSPTIFSELRRPTIGQQYLLKNTGGGSTLAHNNIKWGLVLKDSTNIPSTNWKAILLQCIGDRCYEIQRFV